MTLPTMNTGMRYTSAMVDRCVSAQREMDPITISLSWAEKERYTNASVWKRNRGVGGRQLAVIAECAFYRGADGSPELWRHVSLSYADRMPTWEDVREVKDMFIGPRRLAVQVLPAEDEYVNAHPWVLHIWCRLDDERRIVPDFRGKDSLGRPMI